MKKILFIFTIIASVFIINNFIRSIYDLWKKQDLITSAQKELKLEKEKNQKLKEKLSYISSDKFIEEETRNKLFMVKPNEQILVLKDLNFATESAKIIDSRPNWRKWWDLFF